jgi:hypothetical protein
MEGLINVTYRIDRSTIPGAGKGFFVEEDVAAGRVLMAPARVTATARLSEVFSTDPPPGADTSVVWFEDCCIVSPELADDHFINHSFEPNGVWHLGFVFSLRALRAGEELLLDYRHLIAPGHTLAFRDAATGRAITGYDWKTSFAIGARQVLAALGSAPPFSESDTTARNAR